MDRFLFGVFVIAVVSVVMVIFCFLAYVILKDNKGLENLYDDAFDEENNLKDYQ